MCVLSSPNHLHRLFVCLALSKALREAHKRAAAARWSSVRSAAGLNDGFKEVFDRDQHLPVITESSAEEAAIPGQPQTQAAVAAEAEAVASLRCEGLEKDVTELNKLLVVSSTRPLFLCLFCQNASHPPLMPLVYLCILPSSSKH